MEARDSGSRIRPLPIDDLDGDVPQPPVEPRRRIAPLVVIILGALAFGVIARGLSAGGSETASAGETAPPATLAEAEEPTTTTTLPPPPPPPSLREMLPIVGDHLKLVALTTTAKVGYWEPEMAFPVLNSSISGPVAAEYNGDGTRVAIRSGVGGNSLIIERWPNNPAYIWDATSGVWHDTDPDLFAWTEDDPETTSTIVRIADLTADSSAEVAALAEFLVPEMNHALRAWGDWGFTTTNGPTTFSFDPDGVPTQAIDGVFLDATNGGLLLLADASDEGYLPFLFDPDGTRTELPTLDIDADHYRITADGEWVFAVTIQDDGYTSILARTVHSRSTRLSSIEGQARVIDLTWDDRLFVLQDLESDDLIFKDWNTGAEYRVSSENPVAAVYLADERGL